MTAMRIYKAKPNSLLKPVNNAAGFRTANLFPQ